MRTARKEFFYGTAQRLSGAEGHFHQHHSWRPLFILSWSKCRLLPPPGLTSSLPPASTSPGTVSPGKPSPAPAPPWLHRFWGCHESTSGNPQLGWRGDVKPSIWQHLCFLNLDCSQNTTWGTEVSICFLQTQPSAKLCKQEKTLSGDVTNKFIFPSLKINNILLLFLHVPNQDSKRSSFICHPVNPYLWLMWGDMSYGKAHAAF